MNKTLKPTASAVLPRRSAQYKRLRLWASGGSWQGIARMDAHACRPRGDIHTRPCGGSWRTGMTPPRLSPRPAPLHVAVVKGGCKGEMGGELVPQHHGDDTPPPHPYTRRVERSAGEGGSRMVQSGSWQLEPARRGRGRGLCTEELTPRGAKVPSLAAPPAKNQRTRRGRL